MWVIDVLAGQNTLSLADLGVRLNNLYASTATRCDRLEDPER